VLQKTIPDQSTEPNRQAQARTRKEAETNHSTTQAPKHRAGPTVGQTNPYRLTGCSIWITHGVSLRHMCGYELTGLRECVSVLVPASPQQVTAGTQALE
jgi:hypothetical protein